MVAAKASIGPASERVFLVQFCCQKIRDQQEVIDGKLAHSLERENGARGRILELPEVAPVNLHDEIAET